MRLEAPDVAAATAAPPVAVSASRGGPPGGEALADGLEGPGFAPGGGLYYKRNAEQDAGTFEFQAAEKRAGRGGALKLTVRSRFPSGDELWSERAEVWERPSLRVLYGEGVWYGFAVKFADPVPRDDHRYTIAQWKREIDPGTPGDFSPFLALRLRNGKLFATVETNYVEPPPAAPSAAPGRCAEGFVPVWLRPETNQMRMLVATDAAWLPADARLFDACTDAVAVTRHNNPLPEPGSGWIDFAVFSKPGPDGTGHIEIFANGAPVVTVKGRIGHADKGLGANQYFKFGPYRGPHSDDWTLFFDDFRRSPRRGDVLRNGSRPPA